MITTKGPANTLVLARNNVPVYDVCNDAAEHMDFDRIKNRYLISEEELFECLDAYVDLAESNSYSLTLECIADGVARDIYGIETVAINDKLYFSILLYGKLFFNFDTLHNLYTYTLNLIIIESVLDLKENSDIDPASMHGVVLDAFIQTYGEIDHTNVDHVLSQLDHQKLMGQVKK